MNAQPQPQELADAQVLAHQQLLVLHDIHEVLGHLLHVALQQEDIEQDRLWTFNLAANVPQTIDTGLHVGDLVDIVIPGTNIWLFEDTVTAADAVASVAVVGEQRALLMASGAHTIQARHRLRSNFLTIFATAAAFVTLQVRKIPEGKTQSLSLR